MPAFGISTGQRFAEGVQAFEGGIDRGRERELFNRQRKLDAARLRGIQVSTDNAQSQESRREALHPGELEKQGLSITGLGISNDSGQSRAEISRLEAERARQAQEAQIAADEASLRANTATAEQTAINAPVLGQQARTTAIADTQASQRKIANKATLDETERLTADYNNSLAKVQAMKADLETLLTEPKLQAEFGKQWGTAVKSNFTLAKANKPLAIEQLNDSDFIYSGDDVADVQIEGTTYTLKGANGETLKHEDGTDAVYTMDSLEDELSAELIEFREKLRSAKANGTDFYGRPTTPDAGGTTGMTPNEEARRMEALNEQAEKALPELGTKLRRMSTNRDVTNGVAEFLVNRGLRSPDALRGNPAVVMQDAADLTPLFKRFAEVNGGPVYTLETLSKYLEQKAEDEKPGYFSSDKPPNVNMVDAIKAMERVVEQAGAQSGG